MTDADLALSPVAPVPAPSWVRRGIKLPDRMAYLPVDHRGFPVPWFVAFIDGKPDFRVVAPGRIAAAHHQQRCWLCGGRLGTYKAFVIGCMCAINKVNSEPPSHRECAEFAVQACPFLTQPKMVRNERNMPEEAKEPAGIYIKRNPGSCAIWITRSYSPFRVDGGILFELGAPELVSWWHEARPATRAEVMHSIDTGIHLLREAAQLDGPAAVAELERRYQATMHLLPVA